jgi:hypothetical protein
MALQRCVTITEDRTLCNDDSLTCCLCPLVPYVWGIGLHDHNYAAPPGSIAHRVG